MKIRMGVLYATRDGETVYVHSVSRAGLLCVWRVDRDGSHSLHRFQVRKAFIATLQGQGMSIR